MLYFRYLLVLSICFMTACSVVSDDDAKKPINSSGAGLARLGEQLRERGELGGAMDFYRRALREDPANFVALTGLARTLEAWGDKEEAGAVYKEAIQIRPDDIRLRRLYGKLLIKLDRPLLAQQQYEAALKIDEQDSKSRSGLAISLDYQGRHVDARREYRKALHHDPENIALLNNMAYSYILSHRYDRAIALLEAVVNHPKAGPALRQNLALAYGMAGMDMDAKRVASIDLSPEKVRMALDYYRRQRAERSVSVGAYAELGTYATEAMAVAHAKKMQSSVRDMGGRQMKAVVLPELSTPGGTPRFAVRMMGCARPDDVSRLCEILAKSGTPCVPRGKGGE